MDAAQSRKIGRIHHVLIDIVATRQTPGIHRGDPVAVLTIAPENLADAGRLQLMDDRDRVLVPAPDVDRPEQTIDVGIEPALFLERFAESNLLRIRAVALRHGDVAAGAENTYRTGGR